MSNEENFELVRKFNHAWRAADPSVLDEILATDFVAHDGQEEVRGADGWRQHILDIRGEHGNVETGIDELIGDGNLVAERWWWRSTSDGGAVVRAHGVTMHRILNGRLQENWEAHKLDD